MLPERPFFNPVAKALIAIRKGLSLRPDDRDSALAGLDQLMTQPKAFGSDDGAYLNLSAIYYLLEFDKSPQAVPEAQQRLWQLALHMEEGQVEQTARALDRARQAARDALNKAIHDPSAANRRKLEDRLRALQDAIERHMQALMQQARREHAATPLNTQQRQLTNRELEKLAEQARRAAQQGNMQEAQQRMAELERMLDKLRNARAQAGRSGQRNAQQRQQGKRQMGALQDLIQRQGGLLDHSQTRAEQPRNFGDRPQALPADPANAREADRRVQQALRRALGELMQEFGDLTGKVPQGLGEADQAMRHASGDLAKGNDQDASNAQAKAIQALQKGGQQMSQTMAQQFGTGQQGEQAEGQQGGQGQMGMQDEDGEGSGNGSLYGRRGMANGRGRDPLGRRLGDGSSGADEGSDVRIPEKRAWQQSREIEDELRQRGAERSRPQLELDYIQRLLKQF